MKNNKDTAPHLELLETPVQEKLALAWALLDGEAKGLGYQDHMYQRCKAAAYQIHPVDCVNLLAEVPFIQFARG